MSLTLWHRCFGLALLVFLTAHLGNHLMLVYGAQAHIDAMDKLRAIYQHPIIETLLIAGLIIQISLGVRLIRKRGTPTSTWAWAQVLSGGYMIFFLIQHVPTVLLTRAFTDTDTNVYFAAAVVAEMPLALYFAPYYTLAVTALFTHLAAALKFGFWPRPMHALWALPIIGLGFGLWITLQLMDIPMPPAYQG
jgi:succinate dehydrogenase/fumarate reductase cytochrome b subunit